MPARRARPYRAGMTTTTSTTAAAPATVTRPAATRGVAGVGAAALAASAVWAALIQDHLTVAAPPAGTPGDAGLRTYYAWFVTTLPQERLDIALVVVGLAALAVLIGARPATGMASRIGRYGVTAGALLWIVGNVLLAGGHWATGLLGTHDNPVQVTNAIQFTVDTTTNAFELVAAYLTAAGLCAFALPGAGAGPAALRRWTAISALGLAALATSYLVDAGDLTTWLQVAVGAVLLPVWMVWAGVSPRTGRP
jgi:hypothetical protein